MDLRPSTLVAFYGGSGRDARDRTIETIWAFDDGQLEAVHDFIQWLFPTRKSSAFNAAAPQLTDDDVAAFRGSERLRARARRSLDVMLRFYGLRSVDGTTGAARIEPAADLPKRGPRWWGGGNHNHLRLTRIIDSLYGLGLEGEAVALYRCLAGIRTTHATEISEATVRYWALAARVGGPGIPMDEKKPEGTIDH